MTNHLPGVFTATKKNKSVYYRSSFTFRGRHISLGSYATQSTAHQAYLEAKELTGSSDLQAEDYTSQKTLSFEKWIVLINFRDSGFYFSTPIYLKNKYFLYYLSYDTVLKFDIDDLFFYSSHKIMRRGGHLFVADYGMQLNIINRYGIKNYGVMGKDYLFINGDPTDFRYENIEIINRYHGVEKSERSRKTQYRVYIHLRSRYVVGVYDSETKAAIAYNKAVDILKRNGIVRSFPFNYIEGLSAAAYADIYSHITVSPKVAALTPECL